MHMHLFLLAFPIAVVVAGAVCYKKYSDSQKKLTSEEPPSEGYYVVPAPFPHQANIQGQHHWTAPGAYGAYDVPQNFSNLNEIQSYEFSSRSSHQTGSQKLSLTKAVSPKTGEFLNSPSYLDLPTRAADPTGSGNGPIKITSEKTLIRNDPLRLVIEQMNLIPTESSVSTPADNREPIDQVNNHRDYHYDVHDETGPSMPYEKQRKNSTSILPTPCLEKLEPCSPMFPLPELQFGALRLDTGYEQDEKSLSFPRVESASTNEVVEPPSGQTAQIKREDPPRSLDGPVEMDSEKTLIGDPAFPVVLDPTIFTSDKHLILIATPTQTGKPTDQDLNHNDHTCQAHDETRRSITCEEYSEPLFDGITQSTSYEEYWKSSDSTLPKAHTKTPEPFAPVLSLPEHLMISEKETAITQSARKDSIDSFPVSMKTSGQSSSSLSGSNFNLEELSNDPTSINEDLNERFNSKQYLEHNEESLPQYTSDDDEISANRPRISFKQDHSYIGRLNQNYNAPPTVAVSLPRRVIRDDTSYLKKAPTSPKTKPQT